MIRMIWFQDRKSTRLNSSHVRTSYAVFCLKKKTLGYQNETRDIQILDPTSTGNATSFPLSTKAQDIANFLLNYSTDDAAGRVSQGFVFTEASLGEVVARFETDQAQLYTYPMDLGDAAIVDTYAGELVFFFGDTATTEIYTLSLHDALPI